MYNPKNNKNLQIHNHTHDPLAKQPLHYHVTISTIVFYAKIVELTLMSAITSKVFICIFAWSDPKLFNILWSK